MKVISSYVRSVTTRLTILCWTLMRLLAERTIELAEHPIWGDIIMERTTVIFSCFWIIQTYLGVGRDSDDSELFKIWSKIWIRSVLSFALGVLLLVLSLVLFGGLGLLLGLGVLSLLVLLWLLLGLGGFLLVLGLLLLDGLAGLSLGLLSLLRWLFPLLDGLDILIVQIVFLLPFLKVLLVGLKLKLVVLVHLFLHSCRQSFPFLFDPIGAITVILVLKKLLSPEIEVGIQRFLGHRFDSGLIDDAAHSIQIKIMTKIISWSHKYKYLSAFFQISSYVVLGKCKGEELWNMIKDLWSFLIGYVIYGAIDLWLQDFAYSEVFLLVFPCLSLLDVQSLH